MKVSKEIRELALQTVRDAINTLSITQELASLDDSQAYSDFCVACLIAVPQMTKPGTYPSWSEYRSAVTDLESLFAELSTYDPGYNYRGLFGPNTIEQEMLNPSKAVRDRFNANLATDAAKVFGVAVTA